MHNVCTSATGNYIFITFDVLIDLQSVLFSSVAMSEFVDIILSLVTEVYLLHALIILQTLGDEFFNY